MAKKKKRADFQAPAKASAAVDKAANKARAAAADAGDAVSSAADDVAAKATSGKATSGNAATKQAPSAKKAATSGSKRGAKGSARSSGMSGRTQWMLVIGAFVAIIGAVLIFSFVNAGGGDGVLATTTWDIPARADDTDNGDDDGRIKIADFTGTPTVVNFFASWCVECDLELPYFTQTGEQFADQVDFVFVNANEDSGDWREMMDRHDVVGNFPIGKDIKGTNRNGLMRALGARTNGMPATAFYDSSGRLIKFTSGVISQQVLRNEIAALGVDLSAPAEIATDDS